jgi:hypothetical protein
MLLSYLFLLCALTIIPHSLNKIHVLLKILQTPPNLWYSIFVKKYLFDVYEEAGREKALIAPGMRCSARLRGELRAGRAACFRACRDAASAAGIGSASRAGAGIRPRAWA